MMPIQVHFTDSTKGWVLLASAGGMLVLGLLVPVLVPLGMVIIGGVSLYAKRWWPGLVLLAAGAGLFAVQDVVAGFFWVTGGLLAAGGLFYHIRAWLKNQA